jgi:hypothetical protein
VRLHDVTTGRRLRRFVLTDTDGRQATGASYAAAVSPTGRHLVFGSQRRFLALYEIASGREIRRSGRLDVSPADGRVMVFSPDGRTLAWLGGDGRVVHLTERATLRERHRFVAPQGEVTSLAFSADGTMLLAGNRDTTATVWDLIGRRRGKAGAGKPLSPAELEACWADLAADDGPRSHRAIGTLSRSPKEAAPFLRTRLRPAAAVNEERVARLIADLDSDVFETRENATRELDALEETAVRLYRKALDANPGAELRRRLLALVKKLAEAWRNPSPQRVRALRALEVLERARTPEARRVLEALAKGAAGAWLTVEANETLGRLRTRSP